MVKHTRTPTRQDCLATIARAAARPTNKQLRAEAKAARALLAKLEKETR